MNKLFLSVIISTVCGHLALARCKSIPVKHFVGQFEVVGIEGVFAKCVSKGNTESFEKIKQPGCSIALKLKLLKDGQSDGQASFKIYVRGEICSSKIGSLKDLSLISTDTECCHIEDESDSYLCDGKGKSQKLKCIVSPNWAIDESKRK